MRPVVLLLVSVLLANGCDAPRDPRKTLERVRSSHTLRVGVSEEPPFILRKGEDAEGLEAALIHDFASRLGARVEWVWQPQETTYAALHAFELDLAAGGVIAKTPWKKRVAVTRPFAEISEVVASTGAPIPASFEGHEVTIELGDPVGEALEKKHATVKRVSRLERGQPLVAGSRAHLRELGYTTFSEPLQKQKLALAAPPGENAFLEQLERFLAERHEQ